MTTLKRQPARVARPSSFAFGQGRLCLVTRCGDRLQQTGNLRFGAGLPSDPRPPLLQGHIRARDTVDALQGVGDAPGAIGAIHACDQQLGHERRSLQDIQAQ